MPVVSSPGTAAFAAAQSPGMAPTKTAAEVTRLLREFLAAAGRNDLVVFERFFADDLIYTHSTARIDTKESLIGNTKSGRTVYTGLEASDVVAQDLGDAVVLTGVARVNVSSNGNPVSFGIRFVNVYANRGGEWKMVTWQSTKTPD